MPLNDLASDIQTLRASEAAEKMGAAKLIEEIWPEQPARGYFHICVRLAHRLESMSESGLLHQFESLTPSHRAIGPALL
jgi:hypothetical protein